MIYNSKQAGLLDTATKAVKTFAGNLSGQQGVQKQLGNIIDTAGSKMQTAASTGNYGFAAQNANRVSAAKTQLSNVQNTVRNTRIGAGFGAAAGVGAAGTISAFTPSNPPPVNKQASFMSKVADFQDKYDYPEDYQDHMNTPAPKPSKSGYAVKGIGAGAIGAALGLGTGMLAFKTLGNVLPNNVITKTVPIGVGLGLAAGAALGLNSHKKTNKHRQEMLDNPVLYKEKLQKDWDEYVLPDMQEFEDAYASAVKRNISAGSGAAIGHLAVAATDAALGMPISSIISLGNAANAYGAHKDNKYYKDKYKSLNQDKLKKFEQDIRNSFRGLKQEARDDEYYDVANARKPSMFVHAINND